MGPNNQNVPNFNQFPQQQQGGNFTLAPDQLPQYNVGANTTPNTSQNNFNNFNQFNQLNQAPLNAEQAPVGEQLLQPPVQIPVAQPVVQQPTAAPATSQPTTKQEIKQVEKEWVGKAKTAISATQTDPYEQAHQVAMLMKGYLQTRYGKIVGK